jgi:YVTN family beta-propeller protein
MARSPNLTRRRALTAFATFTGGSGLLTACTAARPRPAATITRTPAGAPAASPAPVTPPAGAPAASTQPVDVYANIAPGMVNPAWAHDPVRVYVPNSLSNTVSEIDPRTRRVIRTFPVGTEPNHVTPSWDGSVLWVNNTAGGSLTPIDPRTGRSGRPIQVADPYNLYFTPDGQYAMVMAEDLNRIVFRDPHTMRPRYSMVVPAAGVNHLDFTADGNYALASCEFSGSVVWIDMRARKVVSKRTLGKAMSAPVMPPGRGYSMPQDVRLSADGETFYVADMAANGVWLISASQFQPVHFIATGAGTHGFQVGRDGRRLFVSNRGEGSISVLDMTVNRAVHKWRIPGGGSPDMGGISPDGTVMWWGGRYDGVVYAMSTSDGRLLAKVPVGSGPHGLCVFPQPGRYSLGHTGNFR